MSNVAITPPPLSSQSMADLLCTIMVLCRGLQPDGKPYWAYMRIKPSMAAAFKNACDQGNFMLDDYGTVVEWGEGHDVPEEVKQRMALQYGASDDFERHLVESANTSDNGSES